MTRFVDVPALGRLVSRVGAGRFLASIAAAMREDFRRWESFEKSARLARPDSRVMGLIGCGAQSEFQAIAFHELLGVDELRIFDIDGSAMHINAVGGDCPGKTELHVDVLRNARIFVEYEPQTRIEGDIQQLPADHPVHELWKVIAGTEPGRESEEQVTVFDSVGFALEDFSALRYVYELAMKFDGGEDIELVPDLRDPRDLFGMAQTRAG